MMEPGAILIAGGLLIIATVSLLWIHVNLPSKRLENSTRNSHAKSVPVGVTAFTSGASSNTNVKKRKNVSSHASGAKKSTFKSKKRKPRDQRVGVSMTITRPKKELSPVATSPRKDDEKQLETEIETVTQSQSDEDSKSDAKEPELDKGVEESQIKECPEELPHRAMPSREARESIDLVTKDETEEDESEDESIVQSLPTAEVFESPPSPKPLPESLAQISPDNREAPISRAKPLETEQEHEDALEVEAEVDESDDTIKSPQNHPAFVPSVIRDREDDSRKKRRRRRRNRSNISQKVHTPTPTTRSPRMDVQADHCSSTAKLDSKSPAREQRQQQQQRQQESQTASTPTRPPLKSHNFALYSLSTNLPGSCDGLSSLENKSLFAASAALSPKPRKKPIVHPAFRSHNTSTLKPYIDDTDNDSTTSGQESKMIHDSDSSSRHRTLSEASTKRGVSDEEVADVDDDRFRVDDAIDDGDMEQPLFDVDSVTSNSVSRTTATSVSDLENESVRKGDEDWNEEESDEAMPLESDETDGQGNGLVAMSLSRDDVAKSNGIRNGKKRHRRSRSRSKNEERRSSRKSRSRKQKTESLSLPINPAPTNSSNTHTPSPAPEIPQQFGQHLAHFASAAAAHEHGQQQQGTTAGQPQQTQFAFYNAAPPVANMVPGQVSFMPYPGVVDLNGNVVGMNMPTFIAPTTMINPMASHSSGDLMAMSSGTNLVGMNLMRSQSDPTGVQGGNVGYMPTLLGAGVPPMTMPQWTAAPIPVSSSSTPMSVHGSLPNPTNSDEYQPPRSRNDSDTLYVVSTPTGGLSLETNQTLGRSSSTPESSLPRLPSNSPGSTPSAAMLGRTPEAMTPTQMVPPQPMLAYTFPQQNLQVPMFPQPVWDPNFLANLQNSQFMIPQTVVPTPTLQTMPQFSNQQEQFRESVLSAPLYQPTHIPSSSPDESGGVSAIPNPNLQRFSETTASGVASGS